MLKLSASLNNLKVVSLRSSAPVGIATKPIINPHNLKIVGWWVKSPMASKQIVLLVDDVREYLSGGLAIDDEEELADPDDLVKYKDVLEINYDLSGKPVKTKRQKIGKVDDYSYNEGMFVQKLYVERPITKVFTTEGTAIIDRRQVLEVTDNYILVKDTEVEAGESEFAGAPAAAS